MSNNNVLRFGSSVEFAQFGKSAIAYVRKVDSSDMNNRFPNGPELPEGLELWGLFGADGRPIAVADEELSLIENAKEMDLVPLMRQ